MSVRDSHRQEQADIADTVWEPHIQEPQEPEQTVMVEHLQARTVTAEQAQARTARAVREPERKEKAALVLVQARTVTAAQERAQTARAVREPERKEKAAQHWEQYKLQAGQ